jgi:pimeloyl-ACP methyl ester carboxylesterase
MSRPGLLFVHGWGLAPDFWGPLRSFLPGRAHHCLDLGFFGPQDLAVPPGDWVGVGHSLGFPRLLGMDASLRAFVSLGGFARFDTPPGPVRAMRRGLSRDAAGVLAAFHQACKLTPELAPDASWARPDVLAQGLDDLLNLDERPRLAAGLGVPLLAVAAGDDAIVPIAVSRAQFGHGQPVETASAGPARPLAPGAVTFHMFDHGGHAFPATRASGCARLIAAFLEEL